MTLILGGKVRVLALFEDFSKRTLVRGHPRHKHWAIVGSDQVNQQYLSA